MLPAMETAVAVSTDASSWDRAAHALRLLAVDPAGLGGAVIRMRASPARDRVMACLKALELRKLPPTIGDDQLLGGLDLAATLDAARVVEHAPQGQRPFERHLGVVEPPRLTPDHAEVVLATRQGPLVPRLLQPPQRQVAPPRRQVYLTPVSFH